jgi:hypothetical protein
MEGKRRVRYNCPRHAPTIARCGESIVSLIVEYGGVERVVDEGRPGECGEASRAMKVQPTRRPKYPFQLVVSHETRAKSTSNGIVSLRSRYSDESLIVLAYFQRSLSLKTQA